MISTAIPGIRDVLVLGKVKQLERDGVADLIVVDAPATGHAITFLTSASGMVSAARGGPLRTRPRTSSSCSRDPARCRVILVTLPEDMPVSRDDRVRLHAGGQGGVQLGPVIVNACDPEPAGWSARRPRWRQRRPDRGTGHLAALEEARSFRLARHAVSAEQIERLGGTFPCPSCSCRHWTRPRSAPPRPRCWPRRWPSGDGARGRGRREHDGRGRTDRDRWGRRPGARRPWAELVTERSVVVCCGSGGVGKTTVSATFAPGGGPGRPALLRRHRRPGTAAGGCAGRGIAPQHAHRGPR